MTDNKVYKYFNVSMPLPFKCPLKSYSIKGSKNFVHAFMGRKLVLNSRTQHVENRIFDKELQSKKVVSKLVSSY